ncbi:hypothetical protein Pmar_PMAR016089 [Perkinsus marinus ATCC 50983]|uniref:Uncharacterized protein n=1 Tax=Perkinsus marinus (strain ATCC 50983 / TXsc) TaxID=423536 RepID=C5LZ03_PERM5|nr:hypothetical protein Pmar_PMAR016089 [Perkinsus marinus ATCC 50983]EEQ98012.1 hypothetical protein Pmar_PMAR016089 [Perkinsus marinus ATCC 50983]|eukprot:XP_002765295.1 hypothetical protein Pmar_PMAR016089 [Perkinsus marinus ATCC 50983]
MSQMEVMFPVDSDYKDVARQRAVYDANRGKTGRVWRSPERIQHPRVTLVRMMIATLTRWSSHPIIRVMREPPYGVPWRANVDSSMKVQSRHDMEIGSIKADAPISDYNCYEDINLPHIESKLLEIH